MPSRILHIGGFPALTVPLAALDQTNGHNVSIAALCKKYPLLCQKKTAAEIATAHIAKERFDIIVCHRSESLVPLHQAFGSLQQALTTLKRNGAHLLYFSYGDEPLLRSLNPALSPQYIQSAFDQILIGGAENTALVEGSTRWTWLGLGIDLDSIPAPTIVEPTPPLKLLHIPFGIPKEDTECIERSVASMREKKLRFDYRTIPAEEIDSVETLRSIVSSCDVFLEHLRPHPYGLLALEALAQGKGVLSGNPTISRNTMSQLSMSPVLDSSAESLDRRLEMVLREPMCLRDLRNRARQFAENNHDLRILSAVMQSVYERL
jgi:hypothetical protein